MVSGEAGDLRRHYAHYDITVMQLSLRHRSWRYMVEAKYLGDLYIVGCHAFVYMEMFTLTTDAKSHKKCVKYLVIFGSGNNQLHVSLGWMSRRRLEHEYVHENVSYCRVWKIIGLCPTAKGCRSFIRSFSRTWKCHRSSSLALCEGNPPMTGGFPT